MADVDVPLGPEDLRDHFVGREAYRRTEYIVAGTAARWRCCACARRPTGRCSRRSPTWRCSPGPTSRSRCSLPDRHRRPEPARPGRRRHGSRCPLRRRMRSLRARELHPRAVSDPHGGSSRWCRPSPRSSSIRWPACSISSKTSPVDASEELTVHPGAAPAGGPLPVPVSRVRAEAPASRTSSIAVPRADWVLVGCARSPRQIHEHFYGDRASTVWRRPRELVGTVDGPTLTKCRLLENGASCEGSLVVVPWGASSTRSGEGLRTVLATVGAGVGARLTDSALYGHLWATTSFSRGVRGTRPTGNVAGDPGGARRVAGRAHDHPGDAAAAIRRAADVDALDLELRFGRDRADWTSTLGLTRAPADPAGLRRRGLLRRHGAGRDRHVDRPGDEAPARSSDADLRAIEDATLDMAGRCTATRRWHAPTRPGGSPDHVRP